MRLLHSLLVPLAALTLLVSFYSAAYARAAERHTNGMVLPPADPGMYTLIIRLYGQKEPADPAEPRYMAEAMAN